MNGKSIFNATVCLMGILTLLIHVVNMLVKKDKRKDELALLDFFTFTILHFAVYLTFTILKQNYTSNAFIIGFYTTFYIMNNIEVLLLFRYMLRYIEPLKRAGKPLTILNASVFVIFVILDVVNVFTGIFFTAEGGEYIRSRTMILSQGYQFMMFAIVFFVAVLNRNLKLREKIAFSCYCFLPFIAIILQNIFKGYAIAYASIVVSIEILFFFLNVQKNIELSRQREKNKEAQIRIMLSQIQPHFVYNSLSAISTLIRIDPDKAGAALDEFTNYLRHSIASLTETRLIRFESELKHIESYVALEQMRFNDRVRIVYDVQATDFFVPPLSIQPIVENAIKHGILKKIEGGTLVLRSYEREDAFVVEVTDDGVGFDIKDLDFNENKHFGMNNIRYRIENMCHGDIVVESEKGKGTKVTVTFYKN